MEGIVPLIPRSHDEMSTDEWVEQYAAIIFEAYLYTKEKQLPISGKSES